MDMMNSTNGAAQANTDNLAYPEGLKITLNAETLRKLALNLGDFQVGQVVDLVGQAEVVCIEFEAKRTAGRDACVELQLVALTIGDEDSTLDDDPAEAQPVRSMADRLFG
jgi:hypothetical protein